MKAFIMFAVLLASVASLMIAIPQLNTAQADDKRIKIDFTIKVKQEKGDKGEKGERGERGFNGTDGEDSEVPGPPGPAGAPGNVTVNVCQENTTNCNAQTVQAGDTITIVVNATGQTVPEEPGPVIPPVTNDTGNDTGPVIPPVTNDTGNDTGPVIPPVTNDTGTGNDTGPVIPPVTNDTGTEGNDTAPTEGNVTIPVENGTVVIDPGTEIPSNESDPFNPASGIDLFESWART